MPTYDYDCTACGHVWEEVQKATVPKRETCPSCHQRSARRLIGRTSFVLVGGGWARDLYK